MHKVIIRQIRQLVDQLEVALEADGASKAPPKVLPKIEPSKVETKAESPKPSEKDLMNSIFGSEDQIFDMFDQDESALKKHMDARRVIMQAQLDEQLRQINEASAAQSLKEGAKEVVLLKEMDKSTELHVNNVSSTISASTALPSEDRAAVVQQKDTRTPINNYTRLNRKQQEAIQKNIFEKAKRILLMEKRTQAKDPNLELDLKDPVQLNELIAKANQLEEMWLASGHHKIA